MPFFVFLPYLLGRASGHEDVYLFRTLLIWIGGVLVLMMPIEYLRNVDQGAAYLTAKAPELFGQSYARSLAGLLLSAVLLALIASLVSPEGRERKPGLIFGNRRLLIYVAIDLVVLVIVWISSRGAAVGAVLAIVSLLLFAGNCGRLKKVLIVGNVFASAVLMFTFVSQIQHHKGFYQQLFQEPVIASELEDTMTAGETPSLQPGHPILGAQTCKNIKDSVADRWVHYQEALAIFLVKPLTGVGANGYGFYTCTGPGWYPHSTILQVLAELGILGGLFYLPMLLMVFVIVIRRYSFLDDERARVNMGWVLAYAVLQVTTSQIYGNYFMSAGLYFVLGLAASRLTAPVTAK
jgi:O-antigen ligase